MLSLLYLIMCQKLLFLLCEMERGSLPSSSTIWLSCFCNWGNGMKNSSNGGEWMSSCFSCLLLKATDSRPSPIQLPSTGAVTMWQWYNGTNIPKPWINLFNFPPQDAVHSSFMCLQWQQKVVDRNWSLSWQCGWLPCYDPINSFLNLFLTRIEMLSSI